MGTGEIFLYPPTLMMKPSNFIKSFTKTLPKYNTKEPLDGNQKPVNKMKKKESYFQIFATIMCYPSSGGVNDCGRVQFRTL